MWKEKEEGRARTRKPTSPNEQEEEIINWDEAQVISVDKL
jgi:hypothetical protein